MVLTQNPSRKSWRDQGAVRREVPPGPWRVGEPFAPGCGSWVGYEVSKGPLTRFHPSDGEVWKALQ